MSKRTPFIVRTIRNHTPQEINYASQKTISYSQFSIYNECPHKWELLYKNGLQEYQPTIHTVFGTAMHNSIQRYITMMYEESGAAADRFDLEGLFEEEFGKTYREEYAKNKKVHFSDPVEMREFYDDGVAIINYFKKQRGAYFSKRGWYLIGCELPIVLNPNSQYPSILYKGYLDLVLYNEKIGEFYIFDIKTSTSGWNDYAKKDEIKQFQLVLYKQFFAKQFNLDYSSYEKSTFVM